MCETGGRQASTGDFSSAWVTFRKGRYGPRTENARRLPNRLLAESSELVPGQSRTGQDKMKCRRRTSWPRCTNARTCRFVCPVQERCQGCLTPETLNPPYELSDFAGDMPTISKKHAPGGVDLHTGVWRQLEGEGVGRSRRGGYVIQIEGNTKDFSSRRSLEWQVQGVGTNWEPHWTSNFETLTGRKNGGRLALFVAPLSWHAVVDGRPRQATSEQGNEMKMASDRDHFRAAVSRVAGATCTR